jgi:succinyl-CoA synthetase beta subunit
MPTLSEADSKARLRDVGVPVARERLVTSADDAVAAAEDIGYAVVAKV